MGRDRQDRDKGPESIGSEEVCWEENQGAVVHLHDVFV